MLLRNLTMIGHPLTYFGSGLKLKGSMVSHFKGRTRSLSLGNTSALAAHASGRGSKSLVFLWANATAELHILWHLLRHFYCTLMCFWIFFAAADELKTVLVAQAIPSAACPASCLFIGSCDMLWQEIRAWPMNPLAQLLGCGSALLKYRSSWIRGHWFYFIWRHSWDLICNMCVTPPAALLTHMLQSFSTWSIW